jgi:hypothetical protein
MSSNRPIDKEQAEAFLHALFQNALNKECGQIELRPIRKYDGACLTTMCNSIDEALSYAANYYDQKYDLYMGVNPRQGGGSKEHVKYVVAFHADIDYGQSGHKKLSIHATQQDALNAIYGFEHQPSVIVHSGGGLGWLSATESG